MKIAEIRKMSDEELEKYIRQISNDSLCAKCGEYTEPREKYHIYISRYMKGSVQTQRKLCFLCKKCYKKMLSDLEVPDIDWR